VKLASNCGLLAHILFLPEDFFGETFLLCGVTVPVGGSSGSVASPPPCSSSLSSPPSCPSTSSSPPTGESESLYPEALSSSSLSMSWTSTFFCFFFVSLDCLTCSTRVTIELPMVSDSSSSSSMKGTRNSSGHSSVIYSISSSIIFYYDCNSS
jgi:hypothetical protein